MFVCFVCWEFGTASVIRIGVNRTQYGRARGSTRVFYLHHTRMITKAAVVRDATMIREQVQCLRQRVCSADAGAGGVP